MQIARHLNYNGGLKVALGCRWLRCVFGTCDCNLLDGGAGLQKVALCYWEMQLQIARRLIMVGSLGCWVVQIARR